MKEYPKADKDNNGPGRLLIDEEAGRAYDEAMREALIEMEIEKWAQNFVPQREDGQSKLVRL